jgi:uncharacterized membrane protein
MRCGNCGVEMVLGSAFCASCGKPANLAASDPGDPAVAFSGLQPNVAGALCYLAGFITGIVFLVLQPFRRDRFVRFHAFQSIFLSAVWILLHFALGMLLPLAPWTMRRPMATLSTLVSLVFFSVAVWLMYKAYSHERFKLPVIGDFAEKHS